MASVTDMYSDPKTQTACQAVFASKPAPTVEPVYTR